MLSKTFFRWSAICVLFGALILSTGYLLRTNIEKELIDNFASTQGLVSSLMVAAGSLLFILGLPALFFSQNLYSTKSGFIASGFAFVGVAAFHLGTLALYFIVPVLVKNPATRGLIYSDAPPFPRFALFWATSLLMQSIGFIWTGIKTRKTSLFSSLLLISGGSIFLSAPFIYFPLIKPANTLVMLGFCFSAIRLLYRKEQREYWRKGNGFSHVEEERGISTI